MKQNIKDYFFKVDNNWTYRPILALSLICILSIFLWMAFAKIDEQVSAQGRVIPAGNTKVIQHLEGGILSDILIKEGQTVKKGDVLFYVKNQKALSDKEEIKIALDSLGIRKERLQAELQGDGNLDFKAHYKENYPEIVQSEQEIFQARESEFKQTLSGFNQQLKQKVLKIDELTESLKNTRNELQVAQEQLNIKLELRKQGAISRSQYLDTLQTVRNFQTRIPRIEKEIPITKSEIIEITNTIDETRQRRLSETGEELNQVKIDIRKLTERLVSYEDEVDRTAIISPVNGIVNDISINTIGGVVPPGGRLGEIIPVNDNLIIEGSITTNDRGKIWPGLPVVSTITAYDYSLYGGVKGELIYISANSFINNQNEEYYQIRASLDLNSFDSQAIIYPGMTAEVNIKVGQITILRALLKPFANIANNAMREK